MTPQRPSWRQYLVLVACYWYVQWKLDKVRHALLRAGRNLDDMLDDERDLKLYGPMWVAGIMDARREIAAELHK